MNDKEKAEVIDIETAPDWVKEALCVLGMIRDNMSDEQVETVQNFLRGDFEAEEKPKPLELWVNVFADGTVASHRIERDATLFAETTDPIRSEVHMREVEPVEPLGADVWHGITADLEIRLFPVTEQLLIRDNGENQTSVVPEGYIPALITALQGLMKGASDQKENQGETSD